MLSATIWRVAPRMSWHDVGKVERKLEDGETSRVSEQCQRLNTAARLPKMMTMMIWISLWPLGRVDSVRRSSKRGFHG